MSHVPEIQQPLPPPSLPTAAAPPPPSASTAAAPPPSAPTDSPPPSASTDAAPPPSASTDALPAGEPTDFDPPLAPPSAEAIHYAGAPAAHRRTLTTGWRWVLACGWATVMAGIGVVANTGFILGDPPFWTGNGLAVLPFLAPVLVLIALAADWRYEIQVSFFAVAVTAAIGLVDLFHATPMGYGELVFAFVALLITVSAMAGLVPRRD